MNERIWIYTLSKELEQNKLSQLINNCTDFVSSWTAHDISLDASFEMYQNRMLIFKVNETRYDASGCSIDKQLRFIKDLEQQFSVELLNRLLVAYQTESNTIEVVKSSQIKELLANNIISENTIVFDNTISQSSQLNTSWKLPLKETWLTKYL